MSVEGKVTLLAQNRVFAKPDIPLEMGLCGGPVLDKDGFCVGILEGVVNPPSDKQSPELSSFSQTHQGSALFVPINDVLRLIETYTR